MEITVIHGQMHKGSTYHVTEQMIQELRTQDTQVNEFFLPKDGPGYCVGCFTCIMQGEEGCPHYEKMKPILEAVKRARFLLVDSPTYCMEMTGQLKTLFDHMGYMWFSHRPEAYMFEKTAIVVTTAAGAGMKQAAKGIAKQLYWMGIPKTFLIAERVSASSWEEVAAATKEKIARKVKHIAARAGKVYHAGVGQRILFLVMRLGQKSNGWNQTDRNHWQKNGWIGGERPWKNH